jgi:hypothetical protein
MHNHKKVREDMNLDQEDLIDLLLMKYKKKFKNLVLDDKMQEEIEQEVINRETQILTIKIMS